MGIFAILFLPGVKTGTYLPRDLTGSWSPPINRGIGGVGGRAFDLDSGRLKDSHGFWREIEQIKPWGWHGFQIDYWYEELNRHKELFTIYVKFDSKDRIIMRQKSLITGSWLDPPIISVRVN